MAVHRGAHGIGEWHFRPQREGIAEHDLRERGVRLGEHEIAHDDDAEELVRVIGDVAVGDERFFGETTQRLDGVAHLHRGPEHGNGRLHEPTDAVLGIRAIPQPLLRLFHRRGGEDGAAAHVRHLMQHLLRDHGIELLQNGGGIGLRRGFQQIGGLMRRAGAHAGEEAGVFGGWIVCRVAHGFADEAPACT